MGRRSTTHELGCRARQVTCERSTEKTGERDLVASYLLVTVGHRLLASGQPARETERAFRTTSKVMSEVSRDLARVSVRVSVHVGTAHPLMFLRLRYCP